MRSIVLLVLLVIGCSDRNPVAELEERMLAPCCWRQALDEHESPLATELRGEIARRAASGEAIDHIESDLVGRYGEKIRTAPPRGWLVGFAIGLPAILGLALLVRFVGPLRHQPTNDGDPEDSHHADRLDAELAAID